MDKQPEKTKQEKIMEMLANQPPFDGTEKKSLEQMLFSPAFKKVLHAVLKESDARLMAVGMMPLFEDAQINKARTFQGEARGLAQAVEKIVELMAPSEPDLELKPEGENDHG